MKTRFTVSNIKMHGVEIGNAEVESELSIEELTTLVGLYEHVLESVIEAMSDKK